MSEDIDLAKFSGFRTYAAFSKPAFVHVQWITVCTLGQSFKFLLFYACRDTVGFNVSFA